MLKVKVLASFSCLIAIPAVPNHNLHSLTQKAHCGISFWTQLIEMT